MLSGAPPPAITQRLANQPSSKTTSIHTSTKQTQFDETINDSSSDTDPVDVLTNEKGEQTNHSHPQHSTKL